MRFSIEQRFEASPADVMAALTNPDLYATYAGLSKVGTPEVVDREQQGDLVRLRLRMRFVADLPSAATAVVDPEKLTWVQEERYDLAKRSASVVFHPDNYADRFSCTGGYTFSGDDRSCTRSISGDLRIRLLLVGGQAEKAMVSGLREHFVEEQPLVARWLAAGG